MLLCGVGRQLFRFTARLGERDDGMVFFLLLLLAQESHHRGYVIVEPGGKLLADLMRVVVMFALNNLA